MYVVLFIIMSLTFIHYYLCLHHYKICQGYKLLSSQQQYRQRIGNLRLNSEAPTEAAAPVAIPKTTDEKAQSRALPGKSWLKCRPLGIGACAGQSVMKNEAFETLVDTSDAWISKRTGIRSRHVIQSGSSLREISITAAKDALKSCNVNPMVSLLHL